MGTKNYLNTKNIFMLKYRKIMLVFGSSIILPFNTVLDMIKLCVRQSHSIDIEIGLAIVCYGYKTLNIKVKVENKTYRFVFVSSVDYVSFICQHISCVRIHYIKNDLLAMQVYFSVSRISVQPYLMIRLICLETNNDLLK